LTRSNITSDFYLGFVVIDKSMWAKKDGVSSTAPQVLNGVPFDEATNPLMAGHCIFPTRMAARMGAGTDSILVHPTL